MAAGSNHTGKVIFCSASRGKIRVKAEEGKKLYDTEATLEEYAENKSRWEFVFDYVEGFIKKMELVNKEIPKQGGGTVKITALSVDLVDPDIPDETWRFDLSIKSPYMGDFINRLMSPDMDWDDMVRLIPYDIAREDNPNKTNSYLVVMQRATKLGKNFDTKIKGLYNADNRDKKQPKFDLDDIEQWKLDMIKYHKKLITDNIIPRVSVDVDFEASPKLPEDGKNPVSGSSTDATNDQSGNNFTEVEDETDDLPF